MVETKPQLKYQALESESQYPVIVVAAGNSTRMNGINKQFAPLKGIPVLVRTLQAFQSCKLISRIIVVTRPADLPAVDRLCSEYALTKISDLIPGGADRHTSVRCGMDRLAKNETAVLIHDGARPLTDSGIIARVTAALPQSDAVVCGVPVVDTLKRTDAQDNVCETIDRTALYAVQTPQAVWVEKYTAACNAVQNAAAFTDDAALMEAAGFSVKMVAGSRRNIKITTPADLDFAACLIEEM